MDLFFVSEDAVGSIFWLPNGWTLYRTIKDYLSDKLRRAGYDEINTPQLMNKRLWVTSGHWEKFRENMFVVEGDRPLPPTDGSGHEPQHHGEPEVLAIKPMNCPAHVQVFKRGSKSYRELPYRLSEFGLVHRNEISGALTGLMRVRAFTQDDAHIFCTEDQVVTETRNFVELLLKVYRDLGFDDVKIKFSDRPDKRAGDDVVWDKAEESLRNAIEALGLEYEFNPGEGAFYGPKLEFVVQDALGRDWQCGTIQVDFVMPVRFDATYVDSDKNKMHPVMLHRAILGSFERFLGIMIENFGGHFPLWLAPVQVTVCPITNEVDEYAQEVAERLRAAGLRTNVDLRSEKISYKIRDLSKKKVSRLAIVGKRERDNGSIALRRFGSQDQEVMSLDDAVRQLVEEAKVPE